MKVCFFGIGSIGKKHIENLRKVCSSQKIDLTIDALRTGNSKYKDEIGSIVNNQFFKISDLKHDYDAVFICNPTSLHYETLKLTKNLSNNFFVEKPIFDKEYNIVHLDLNEHANYYVACPLRFKQTLQKLQQIIANEKVNCARIICSSYLPDWRQGVDYRTSYSAKASMGGGVSIDLIHEIDYMVWLLGFPQKVNNVKGQFSDLEIDSNDISTYIFEYENMIAEVHLDYFGIKAKREIEIFTNDKYIIADLLNDSLAITEKQSRKTQEIKNLANDFYLDEMEYFVSIINQKNKSINNLNQAAKILHLAKGRI